MILCHVGFTILSDQCSQNNFPIIKTRPFKVTNIKLMVDICEVGEDKICIIVFFIILCLLLKNKNKDTHNIQIKPALFSGTIGIFSRSIQEIE